MPKIKPISKEEFDSLTKHEQRVLLAKDVLQHLASGKLIANRGDYIGFHNHNWEKWEDFAAQQSEEGKNNQEIFQNYLTSKDNDNNCHVCAKGALVCAFVYRFDGHSFRQADNLAGDHRPHSRNKMVRMFGTRMWCEIELHFEGGQYKEGQDYQRHSMESLMENIIRNKGNFVTEDGRTIK